MGARITRKAKSYMGLSGEFDCDLYFERSDLTHEWLIALCHHLWQYGASINTPDVAATWDEQLTLPFPHQPYTDLPLAGHIDHMVEYGFGELHFWDRGVCLTVYIDPTFRLKADHLSHDPDVDVLKSSPFGLVTLNLASPQVADNDLPPDLWPRTAYLIRPKYQAYLAMVHWTALVSAVLHPVFGVGYHNPHELAISDNEFWHTHHQHILKALAQGHMPALDPLFEHTPILYAGPQFVTPDLLRTWAVQPEQSVRLLPDGALLAYHYPDPYTIALAQEFMARGDDQSLPASERLVYLQRARAIYSLYRGHRESYASIIDYGIPSSIAEVEHSLRTDVAHE